MYIEVEKAFRNIAEEAKSLIGSIESMARNTILFSISFFSIRANAIQDYILKKSAKYQKTKSYIGIHFAKLYGNKWDLGNFWIV